MQTTVYWYQGSYHGGDLQCYEFREVEVSLAERWEEFFVKPSTAARGWIRLPQIA